MSIFRTFTFWFAVFVAYCFFAYRTVEEHRARKLEHSITAMQEEFAEKEKQYAERAKKLHEGLRTALPGNDAVIAACFFTHWVSVEKPESQPVD